MSLSLVTGRMVTRTGRGVTESEDEAADSEETGPAFALAVSVWADKQTLSGLTRSEIWSRVTLTMTLLHADDGSVLIQRGEWQLCGRAGLAEPAELAVLQVLWCPGTRKGTGLWTFVWRGSCSTQALAPFRTTNTALLSSSACAIIYSLCLAVRRRG